MAKYAKQKTSQTAEALMPRLRQGDESAFKELYVIYYNRLMQYGRRIENNRDLIHDAIQEFFIWFLQNPQQTKKIQNLDRYIFKSIRRNLSVLAGRERQVKLKAQNYQPKAETEALSSEDLIIEEERLRSQHEWLQEQIGRLPIHQKEAVHLRFFEHFEYDDIAVIFSVSNQVVRNTIFRAIKNLRKNAARP